MGSKPARWGLGGDYITLDDPRAAAGLGTVASGIDDAGQIVGFYYDFSAHPHGFLYCGGVYTTLDDPLAGNGAAFGGAAQGTYATGINAAGQIVGYYLDSNGIEHGFLYNPNGATYTTLDDPLANQGPVRSPIPWPTRMEPSQLASMTLVRSSGITRTVMSGR
jgi:probable HAF family extracellular repeat protein